MKNFTNKEIEYIKKNFKTKTYKQLSEDLDILESSVKYIISELGLCKQPHKKWNQEEDEFLIQNYDKLTSAEIAKKLNRTIPSINARREKLGLIEHLPWTEEEIILLKQNYLFLSHEELGKILNRSKQAITAKCFELNLYKKELPWTEEEINFVKKNYMEMPTREIAEILNRSMNAVQLKAQRMGYKKFPYQCNYHYFDSIDTEEKAYWLGFIAADGWMSKTDATNSAAIGIELQYGDLTHLKKFNKSIDGNYKIVDRWRQCNLSDSDKKNHMCSIRIYSITMYNSLMQYFSSEKTYSVRIPDLQKDLLRHFIRGFFDGDGCFCLSNKSFKIGFITASEDMKNDLENIISSLNIKVRTGEYISEFGTHMYRPDIDKKSDMLKFLDWMYMDSNIYLDRKYKKYLKAKNKYDSLIGLAS